MWLLELRDGVGLLYGSERGALVEAAHEMMDRFEDAPGDGLREALERVCEGDLRGALDEWNRTAGAKLVVRPIMREVADPLTDEAIARAARILRPSDD